MTYLKGDIIKLVPYTLTSHLLFLDVEIRTLLFPALGKGRRHLLYSILAFYSLIRSPLAFYRGAIKYGVLRFAVHRTFGSLGEHHTCEKTSSGNFPPQGASGNCLLILPSATPPYSAATTVSSDSCLCMFRGRNSNSPRSRPQSER